MNGFTHQFQTGSLRYVFKSFFSSFISPTLRIYYIRYRYSNHKLGNLMRAYKSYFYNSHQLD